MRACGHKPLSLIFFYHANGTVFTISYFMLICLLSHIICLEKSTAAYFQPPFAPIVQAVHWLTPNRSHADCYCVYLKLTAQNTLWADLCLSTHTLTIKLCYHTQIYKVWYPMFCISDQQKSVSVKVSSFFLLDSYHMVEGGYFSI